MEYEFRQGIDGSLHAAFSMDHEVIGRWLTDEIGRDPSKIASLITKLNQVQTGESLGFTSTGRCFSLEIDQNDVSIISNEFSSQTDDELQEFMTLYTAESQAFCGVDDFHQVLLSWQAFIIG